LDKKWKKKEKIAEEEEVEDERREKGERRGRGREGTDSQRLTVPYSLMKKSRR
jgi:hypothetical protein